MARTLYGNLTGRAASIERSEQMALLFEQQEKEQEQRKHWRDEFADTLRDLKVTDKNWEAWYDKELPERWNWNAIDVLPILQKMETRMRHIDLRDEIPHLLSVQN